MFILLYSQYRAIKVALYPLIAMTVFCSFMSQFHPLWWAMEVLNIFTLASASFVNDSAVRGETAPDSVHMRKKNRYLDYNGSIYVRKRILGIPVWIKIDWRSSMADFIDHKIEWLEKFNSSQLTV